MYFNAFLLASLLKQHVLFPWLANGHEMTCAAGGQESARSSSLIQGVVHRSSTALQSARQPATDFEGPRLAKLAASNEIGMAHNLPNKSNAEPNSQRQSTEIKHMGNLSMLSQTRDASSLSSNPGDGDLWQESQKRDASILSSKPGDGAPNQLMHHALLALVQHSSDGSVGTIMFITAVFFLLGVVFLLVVALSPTLSEKFDQESWPEEDRLNKGRSSNMPATGGEKVVLNYGAGMGQGVRAPGAAAQYSSTRLGSTPGVSQSPAVQIPPPTVTAGDVKLKALSPQLVVPEDCECALVLKQPTSGWRGKFAVCDTRGSPVLQVMIEDTIAAAQQALEIQLSSSAVPNSMVARCRILQSGKNPTFCVYQKEGLEVFATVTYEAVDKARLVLAAGGYFDFMREDPDNVRVVDEHGQLHGTSESYSPSIDSGAASQGVVERDLCLVRVGPLSDAGLVLCGLMCFHYLDLESAARGSLWRRKP